GEGSDQSGGHGELAVLDRRGGDGFAGGDDLGMIEVAGLSDAMAEVAGSEEQAIKTGDCRDGLDLLERFGRLDLEDDEALGVRVVEIFVERHEAELPVDIAAIERAFPD